MKHRDLIDLEQKALALQNAGQFREAAEAFLALVKERPDWEHGNAYYSLGWCYENLAEFDLAEKNYLEALRYEPKNPYFLEGLAAFQALHRDHEQAFNTYLTLLKVYRKSRDQRGIEFATTTLKSLGKKLGLSDETVAEKIRDSTT